VFSGCGDGTVRYYGQLGEVLIRGVPMEAEYRRLLAAVQDA
jgi:hypothetical protein